MSPGGWLSVAAICALGAASPGPSLAVVVRHALRSRRQGIACALAHALGVGLYALVTVIGLAAVLASRPAAYRALAAAGALYLLWLGIAVLRGSGEMPNEADDEATELSAATSRAWPGAARDGFAIALLNPKIAIFFLALFSQFVRPAAGVRDTVVLSLTALGIDGLWYLLVALVFSGAAVGRLRAHRRGLDRLMGVLLIGVAAWTLARALSPAA